jgi:hypothetical protein
MFSPYEIQQRLSHAQSILEEVDRDYIGGRLDIEDAVARYTNVLTLYRGVYEDSNASLGPNHELTIWALAMVGVITARIGQVYQELDLDFEESFEHLVKGYKILNDSLMQAPLQSPLSQWVSQQINWCLGLLGPIRGDGYDPQKPDTWKFKEPSVDYLAKIGLTYSILASRKIVGTVEKILLIYTQTLVPPEDIFVGVNTMMDKVNKMKRLVETLKNATLSSEGKKEFEKILELYNFSSSQVRSIAELLYS